MNYKSITLLAFIKQFNKNEYNMPELKSIYKIEKEHNINLTDSIRLVPVTANVSKDEQVLEGLTFRLEILKSDPKLSLGHVQQSLLTIKTLKFVDSFSNLE